jgi:serine/threonine protein kinase
MRTLSSPSQRGFTQADEDTGMTVARELSSWSFAEEEELVPGRLAVRLLGGGPRHEAYLAWDVRLNALVVVKLPRPGCVDEPRVRAGLAAEGEALACLAHPVLPRLFAGDVAAERPYLVLEHLDGPRLSTAIRRYRLAIEQVVPLALQLCSVLHYLRDAGWVHLDLKPKNVILGGPPRLIDLSVARPLAELGGITAPVGTAAYMAPEQCDPARFATIGTASDVWGLGVTLYDALERRLPFPAPDLEASGLGDRYPQTALTPAPLSREVPLPLADSIRACLSPDPADRPAPAELAARLEPVEAALTRPRLGRFRPRA